MNTLRKLLLLSVCCTVSLLATAQTTTLQVVTKTVKKYLPFHTNSEVNINGEKADVFLETWDREEIGIEIELVAKHPDKKVAEEDLESLKYLVDKIGRRIYIRNYIALPKGGDKPRSTLKAKYVIHLPANCPVNLTNYFGNADIRDLDNSLSVDSEFCNLRLTNIKGSVDIKTRFGDLDGERLSGKVTITSQRSDIRLTDLKGVFDINAKYGVIWVDADESLVDLTINAEKSDVHFLRSQVGTYRFALRAEHGKITVPNFMDFDFTERTTNIQQAILSPEVQQATVNISTSFGNIVIGRVQQ